ncbi:MAG: NAD(P)-binding protein [Myxococcota bacterium]
MSAQTKKKIAVLGGGMGSLSTIWYLTQRKDWQQHYEIDVYQFGWRLGGKGASGRDEDGADRILEHGIHMMFGFYDNALELLRDMYAELGRDADAPMATFDQAFLGHGVITLTDELANDPSDPFWTFYAPKLPERVPGTDSSASVLDLLNHVVDRVRGLVDGEGSEPVERTGARRKVGHAIDDLLGRLPDAIDDQHWLKHLGSSIKADVGAIGSLVAGVAGKETHLLGSLLDDLKRAMEQVAVDVGEEITAHMRDAIVAAVKALQTVVDGALYMALLLKQQTLRRVLQLASLGLAIVRGVLQSFPNLWAPDWFSIDDQTFEDWLMAAGCPEKVANSCLTQVLRQVGFAGTQGAGAGTTLHWAMRMVLDYGGWFMYKMAAGMGDIIFAPLYEVLEKRGVRFHFFHRVDALRHKDGVIDQVEMGQQVTVKAGDDGIAHYRPLVQIQQSNGVLPCWPDRPLFDQLNEGLALKGCWQQDCIAVDLENWWTAWADQGEPVVLKHGVDFDYVVLGISVGMLSEICADLCEDDNNPAFKAMVEGVVTTQTKAFQFWMTPTTQELGFTEGEGAWSPFGSFSPVLGTYPSAFDTWADMSQVLTSENWPIGGEQPQSLAYWCAYMADDRPWPTRGASTYLHQQLDRCLVEMGHWCAYNASPAWPQAVKPEPEDEPHSSTGLLGRLVHAAAELLPNHHRDSASTPDPMDLDLLVAPPPANPVPLPCKTQPATDYASSSLKAAADHVRDAMGALNKQYYRVPYNPSERYVLSVPGSVRKRLMAWDSGYANLVLAGDWTLNPISAGCIEATVQSGAMASQALAGVPEVISDYWLFEQPPAPLIWMPPNRVGQEADFINPVANLLPAPPYLAKDATVEVFVLHADNGVLGDICDRMLNLGGDDLVFRPMAPMVLFVAATIPEFVTGQPVATSPEQDYGFWVPVLQGTLDSDGAFQPESFAFFLPILWVDPPLAVRAGREIFGYQKSAGRLARPSDSEDGNQTWTVDGYVADGAPGTVPAYSWQRIVEVVPHNDDWSMGEEIDLNGLITESFEAIEREHDADLAFPAELIKQLVKEVGGLQFPMVFLKQFRSISNSQKASYQAVTWGQNNVESPLVFNRMKGPFTVDLTAFTSCDVATGLGLTVDANGDAQALVSASVTFDFEAMPGRVLHRVT